MTNYNMEKSDQLQEITIVHASMLGVTRSVIRFAIDGERIASSTTAAMLGLKDNDIIEDMLEQKGGSVIHVADDDQAPPIGIADKLRLRKARGKNDAPDHATPNTPPLFKCPKVTHAGHVGSSQDPVPVSQKVSSATDGLKMPK